MEFKVGDKINEYLIIKFIGCGSFGNVYEAVNKKGHHYALKVPITSKGGSSQESIIHEYNMYSKLSSIGKGIMPVKITKYNDITILVMDLLGPSIDKFVSKYKRLDLKTTIIITIQLLESIKYIHSTGYIHRDIKPKNLVIKSSDPSKISIIDFGLCTKFDKTVSSTKVFCGTERYASISAHKRYTQSRKDDLQSILYTIVYIYKGSLPWQGIKNSNRSKRLKIVLKKKQETPVSELCKGMPREFEVLGRYIDSIDFDEKPHYTSMIRMFNNLFSTLGYVDNNVQWVVGRKN